MPNITYFLDEDDEDVIFSNNSDNINQSNSDDIITRTNPRKLQKHLSFKEVKKGKRTLHVPSLDPVDEGEKQVQECIDQYIIDYAYDANKANFRATLFKLLNIMIQMILIVLGIVVGVLSLEHCDSGSVSGKLASAIGFISSALVAIKAIFQFEKRSVLLKTASFQLKKLMTDLNVLKWKNISVSRKIRVLAAIQEKAEDICLAMFDIQITSLSRSGDEKRVIDMSSSSKKSDSENDVDNSKGEVEIDNHNKNNRNIRNNNNNRRKNHIIITENKEYDEDDIVGSYVDMNNAVVTESGSPEDGNDMV